MTTVPGFNVRTVRMNPPHSTRHATRADLVEALKQKHTNPAVALSFECMANLFHEHAQLA